MSAESQRVGPDEVIRAWRNKAYSAALADGSSPGDALVQFYDASAEEYDELSEVGGYHAPVNFASIVADVISDKSTRILDAASGTGMVGKELKVRGFTCIDALDPSRVSLDKSKETGAYTDYICDTLDDHQTDIQDDRYSAVVMCGAFGIVGHVTDACFPELIRVTKLEVGGYHAPVNFASIVADVISDKSTRILDAASGTGMVGKELKVRGFTCIDALDPSRVSLDKSKETGAYTDYICDTLDDHQTDIQDDRYSAVVMCGAFGIVGHVTDACFPELIRVTKLGGYIILSVCDRILNQWEDKLDAAIRALSQRGLWELVQYRWIPYMTNQVVHEKAKVVILKVLKKNEHTSLE